MPIISTNFAEVPDKLLPVEPGIQPLKIKSIERQENKNKNGFNLVVTHEVMKEGKDKGRTIDKYISEKMLTMIKNLANSCGLNPTTELDTNDLIEKVCLADVGTRQYNDNGTMKEASEIKKYLIPSDPEWAVHTGQAPQGQQTQQA